MPYGERALPHTCHTCLQRKYHAPSPDHPDRAEQFAAVITPMVELWNIILKVRPFKRCRTGLSRHQAELDPFRRCLAGRLLVREDVIRTFFHWRNGIGIMLLSPFLMSRNHLQDNLRIFLGQVICFTPVAFDVPIREPLNSSKPCVLWPILAMVSQMPLAREHGSVAMSFQRFRNGHGVMVK